MKKPPAVTLKTIAAEAQVHTSTVSLALRNNRRIPEATRVRIQQIAERLEYRPDPKITSLMEHIRRVGLRTQSVTLAMLNSTDSSLGAETAQVAHRFFAGARTRALSLGFGVEEFKSMSPGMTGKRLTRILAARGIQGLVVGPMQNSGSSIDLDWAQFAHVAFGFSMPRPFIHRVVPHQVHAITLAMKNLTALGYKKIGLVESAEHDLRADHSWVAGYLQYNFLNSQKFDSIPPLVEQTIRRDKFLEWFAQFQPDAIISSSVAVVQWLREIGVRCPEHIGIVSLNIDSRQDTVTGIDQNFEQVGKDAVDIVSRLVAYGETGVPAFPRITMVESVWVEGSSTRRAH